MIGPLTTHVSLLGRLAAGTDPGAWAEFSDRYADLIRGFARRRGVRPAECDDVLQDVMMALVRSMPGFAYDPAKGTFRGYLKTVALRIIGRKSCQTQAGVSLELMDERVAASEDDAEAERQWEAEWRQYHLSMAMKIVSAEFNAADLSAFERYGLGGEDARQTADALDLTVDQVYQAKSRILRRLSAQIEQQIQAEG